MPANRARACPRSGVPSLTGRWLEVTLTALSVSLPLTIFLTTWMFSALIIPLALTMSVAYRQHHLLLALAAYFTYRLFFGLPEWKSVVDDGCALCAEQHAFQMRLCKEHHYFRSQQTVLECPPIPPNSKSLLGWHPHGILCVGWILNGNVGEQLFNSEFRWLTAPVLFKLPLLSEMLTWYNCAPSSAQSMKTRMKTGENIALIPGGFQEATTYHYGKHRAYLTRRKGFIKYALQHGYRVYPVWTFGEERTYYSVAGMRRLRLWLNKYHIPTVLFIGKYLMMPFRNVDLVSVVGKPLELPMIVEPTKRDVKEWHDKYTAALRELFERNKAKYAADPNEKLEIL